MGTPEQPPATVQGLEGLIDMVQSMMGPIVKQTEAQLAAMEQRLKDHVTQAINEVHMHISDSLPKIKSDLAQTKKDVATTVTDVEQAAEQVVSDAKKGWQAFK